MRLLSRLSARLGLAALAVLSLSSPARANGRFPAATQLVFHPTDKQSLLLRVTFGILHTHDGGKSFSWVCERAVGYGGTQDPAVGLTSSGAILVAAFEGLATSLDDGCSFSFVDVALKEFVIDVAVDKPNPASAVAITSTGKGSGTFNVQVLETIDAGKTWAFVGTPIDKDFLAETIDSAPTRPQRLYVSGFSSTEQDGKQIRHGALFASDDRGTTWERHEIDLGDDKSVYIAAVDPNNPDRVYLRTKGLENDRLLRTDDGGKSTVELTTVTGSMLGFAVSPDGSTLAVGGPTAGLLVGDAQQLNFTKTSGAEIACLGWNDQGLHACGNAFKDGFALARSADQGKTFEPLLASFNSLTGPQGGCSTASSPTTLCAEEWTQLKTTLGIKEGTPGGAAGAGGSDSAGGSGGSGGAGGQAGFDNPAAQPDSGDKASPACGCSTVGAPHDAVALGLAALAAGWLRWRRRR